MEFRGRQIGVVLFWCSDAAAVCEHGKIMVVVFMLCAIISNTTFSDGCLGLDNDEGRSEV